MLQLLLIATWLIFGTMSVCALSYKDHRDNQILGVTLSREHAKHPEVQKVIKKFKIACYLVLLISIAFSFLMPAKMIGQYAEFYMLVLITANIFANWFVIHFYQQGLLSIKKEKAWIYKRTRVVTVDMNVSKEKGKSSVASIWTWLFLFLSFIPAVFLLLHAKARESYPIGFSLIGPLCQLNAIYLYYQMRHRHVPALSDNTEINKACARTEERINTMAATLLAFAMFVFWVMFNISVIYEKNAIFVVLSAIILVTVPIMIAYWQRKKIRTAENNFFGEMQERDIFEQESTWKWGCYYNPNDSRIIVPKRIASMGFTINIGNPVGKAIGFGIIVLLLLIFSTIFYGGFKDYTITENGSRIIIDAAMYDRSVEKNQVVSLSTIDRIPVGTRTNGYGGLNKSYGHFSINGYGKCMLYIYNKVDKYIVLKLKGDNPAYIIVNDKSQDKTERLYQEIKRWLTE